MINGKKVNTSEYFGDSFIIKLHSAKMQAEKEEIAMIHNRILNNNFQKRLNTGSGYE